MRFFLVDQHALCETLQFDRLRLRKLFLMSPKEDSVDQQNKRLRVHTNKVEGFWSHMKHKIKRIRGTSEKLKSAYVGEAVLRQNCRVGQQ
uniref:Transposase n=1 Tax=Ditylenchus dipsaci TaxID=166011 RepID=A0A915EJZ5_9BILA